MAQLNINGKANRVLKFQLGMREPENFRVLSGFGFNRQHLQDGWNRIKVFGELYAKRAGRLETVDPKLIQRLDDYENLWFPIMQATLDAHYPEISAQVFENVS
jgi:hypothetical protein